MMCTIVGSIALIYLDILPQVTEEGVIGDRVLEMGGVSQRIGEELKIRIGWYTWCWIGL